MALESRAEGTAIAGKIGTFAIPTAMALGSRLEGTTIAGKLESFLQFHLLHRQPPSNREQRPDPSRRNQGSPSNREQHPNRNRRNQGFPNNREQHPSRNRRNRMAEQMVALTI